MSAGNKTVGPSPLRNTPTTGSADASVQVAPGRAERLGDLLGSPVLLMRQLRMPVQVPV
jgi:hypothetical protein